MRSIIFATFTLVLLATNVACNTIHGFGEDVERVGEKTQDAADAGRKKLEAVKEMKARSVEFGLAGALIA